MKYGIVFGTIALLLTATAVSHGGWYLLFLWPAVSFGIVALGYLWLGPSVFGKSAGGRLSPFHQLPLAPYLVFVWSVWHVLRFVKREPAFTQLTDHIFIGRRLLSREFPSGIDHVVDLTCEFNEPARLRSTSYHSFPILDGFVPTSSQLWQWAYQAACLSGNIYIHCAEGHGRTGLFVAVLLQVTGHSRSPEEALEFIKSRRPLVQLNRCQMAMLSAIRN